MVGSRVLPFLLGTIVHFWYSRGVDRVAHVFPERRSSEGLGSNYRRQISEKLEIFGMILSRLRRNHKISLSIIFSMKLLRKAISKLLLLLVVFQKTDTWVLALFNPRFLQHIQPEKGPPRPPKNFS